VGVLETVAPVFAIVGLGFWLAGRRPLDGATLADLALLVTLPALLFSVLARAELHAGEVAALAGGAVFVMGGTGVLAALYARAAAAEPRGVLLPAMLWNAGNMALPVARLAFGEPGLQAAALVFVVLATAQSSVGVWIAKGEGGLAEPLRLPLLWAALAGIAVSLLGVRVPRLVLEPVEMLGAMAIPLMLVHLGIQLRRLPLRAVRPAVAAAAIRSGGGVALAWLFVSAFGVAGVTRDVLLLDAIMPPALITGVLADRYGASPQVVASAIVLGTLASAATIPALLSLLT
jgi:malate permease and related proteins